MQCFRKMYFREIMKLYISIYSSSVMMLMASAGRGAFCAFVDVFYVVKMCVVCINILYKLHEAHNYMGLYFHAT